MKSPEPRAKPKEQQFRSGLEKSFYKAYRHYQLPFEYEMDTFPYIVERKYLADFYWREKGIVIETKGFFRQGDTQKYQSIGKCLPEGHELIFVLSDPRKKVRKGGKITMGQWCDKEGFKYFTMDNIEELFEYVVNL